MNSYQTGNTAQKPFNGTANRPMGINPPEGMNPNYMNMPQMRPRMDAPNINTNQHQMQQQNSINPNYQQRPRFPEGGGLNRVQPNPAGDVRNFRPNDSYQNQNFDDAQKNLGNNSDSKMYSAQQQRFSNPPQVRPPFNDSLNAPKPANLNQTANAARNPLPSQETSAIRNQNNSNPPNLKPGSEPMLPENYKNEQKSGAIKNEAMKPLHQTLSRRDSSLEMASNVTLNNSQKINENNLKKDIENDVDKNEKTNSTVNKVEIDQLQPTAETVKNEQQQPLTQTADSTKNEQQKPVTQTNDLKKTNSNQNENSLQPQKNVKKETNNDEDSVTKGLVHKNIQYFEEKDTAKTPLLPKTTINQKDDTGSTKKTNKVDVIESTKESGVDETPMIHPNLRSIYQEPYKVVKIGQFRSGKHKPRIIKKQSRTVFEDRLKKKSLLHHSDSIHLYNNVKNYSQNKRFLNKKQKTQMFTPEEELLAFFHNSKEMRKIKFDDSQKRSRSASRNRVTSKPTANGDIASSKKTPTKLPTLSNKNPSLSSPTKTPLKSPGTPGSKITPKTPETPSPPTPLIKKVPMNKIQVGAAPSPNLKAIRSKVGSLANTTHKPGGGNIKIESHKVDFSKAQPRIEAKNEQYTPSGGDKKIQQVKLQWSAKSKVGSLENATYKPGGGDKKIESVKLDFKEKAKPKVGSKDNVKHVPGGGCVKIENQKLEFKAQSKVGSLDNVKHKPGGGEIKIFDDKTYLKQISGNSSEGRASGAQSPLHTSISKTFSETSQEES